MDDVLKMANGELDEETDDEFAIKTVLELVNFCANMSTIRKGATESALNYLLLKTNNNDHDQNSSFRKRSRLRIKKEEGETSYGRKCNNKN